MPTNNVDGSRLGGRGYVQIYTGDGKGKTTAALGLAVRAAGYGLRTYIGQFLKGQKYSELNSVATLADFITIEQFGKNTFVHIGKATDQDIAMAKRGLEKCRQAMCSRDYDLVILDEVCIALYLETLTVGEVLSVLAQKPKRVELVLTGRNCPQELIDHADLVTEMKNVKHYFNAGVGARFGIEK